MSYTSVYWKCNGLAHATWKYWIGRKVTNRHSIAYFRLKSLKAPFFLSSHPSLNRHYAANRAPSISWSDNYLPGLYVIVPEYSSPLLCWPNEDCISWDAHQRLRQKGSSQQGLSSDQWNHAALHDARPPGGSQGKSSDIHMWQYNADAISLAWLGWDCWEAWYQSWRCP